jgi:hypothetical protein
MGFDKRVTNNIEIREYKQYKSSVYQLCLKNDKRNLFYIDINKIPNVFEYTTSISKN